MINWRPLFTIKIMKTQMFVEDSLPDLIKSLKYSVQIMLSQQTVTKKFIKSSSLGRKLTHGRTFHNFFTVSVYIWLSSIQCTIKPNVFPSKSLCNATIFCLLIIFFLGSATFSTSTGGWFSWVVFHKEIKSQQPQSCRITKPSCLVDASDWLS